MLLEEINKKNAIDEIFAHFIGYYKKIAQKSGYEFSEANGEFYVKTPINSPVTNFIISNRLDEFSINKYNEYFGRTKYSFLIQSNDVVNINLLSSHEFSPLGEMDFMRLTGSQHNLIPNGYKKLDRIVVVNDYYSQAYIDYINVGMKAFDVTYDILHSVTPLLKNNDTEIFVGYYNNIPVTSCITIKHEYKNCIFGLNTDKEFRRQGFATDLIKKIMVLYDHQDIVLYSWPETINLYRKLGFMTIDKILYLSQSTSDKV